MAEQTLDQEGTAVPTPAPEMSPQDSAPAAEPQAKPAEVQFAEKALGREFTSVEEAEKAIKNLNSFVGDQTISKQRKALENAAKQADVTFDEVVELLNSQSYSEPTQVEEPTQVVRNLPDDTTKRLVRIETDTFVKDVPEASVIRNELFAEAIQTGKPVGDLWAQKYAPIVEAGKKLGAKKLQTTLEGQPTRATSAVVEGDAPKVDFSKMSRKEMEEYMGAVSPTARL